MSKIRIVAVSGPADSEAHTTIWQGDDKSLPSVLVLPANLEWREMRTIREEWPEVLWESRETGDAWPVKILADGSCLGDDGSGWRVVDVPTLRELARRLLEERKQQEALDDHNDKLEEAEASERAAWAVMNEHQDRIDAVVRSAQGAHDRLQVHDRRLTKLEGELAAVQGLVNLDEKTLNIHLGKIEKLEQDLLLVRGQAAHVDEREAADFEATRIHLDGLDEGVAALKRTAWKSESAQIQINNDTRKAMEVLHTRILQLENKPLEAMEPHAAVDPASPSGDQARVNIDYSEWKRLVTLDELWGPEGTLRMKLAGTAVHTCPLHGLYLDWFRVLRSELLALPDEVKR